MTTESQATEMESTSPSDTADEQPVGESPKGRLFTRGFVSLLAVSFFGAANDNVLKQILMLMVAAGGVWANRLGAGSQGAVGLVLTVPFIILSGYAGQIADKFSKRRVMLWVKIAEVPIAVFAALGLILGSFWMSLTALLMLAVQSSFYGPAKFGCIPDVVDDHRLSQANGLINAISNVAVILGSLAAGPLADLYYPTIDATKVEAAEVEKLDSLPSSLPEVELNKTNDKVLVPDPNRTPTRWPAGLALIAVSGMGLVCVLLMPPMKPVDPDLKLSRDIFSSHIQTFKDSNRPLLVVLFSWSGFYMIGMLALLLLPEYKTILVVNNTAITNLIGLLAISIVVGSVLVGVLSGKTIRPYFAVFGATGMTICFLIMGLSPLNLTGLAILIFLIGIFAGFYIVPLQSLLQFLSPSDERGRFFGTANALSFVFTSGASLLYWSLTGLIGLPPVRIPLVCAGLATVGTLVGLVELNRIMAAQKSTRVALEKDSSEPQAADDS